MASKEELVHGYPLGLFQESTILDKYLCGSCGGCVARDIHMVQCCRRQVCLSCIKPYLNKKPCPYCEEEDFDILPLKKDNEKINNLKVCCTEKISGCKWSGLLKDLKDHLRKEEEGCKYSPRECPECQELVHRHEMINHLSDMCPKREYRCPHCNYQDRFDYVTEAHMPECSNYPVPCPNTGCGVTCERNDIDQHIKEICEEQHIDCEYKYAGCDVKYRRKNKDDHMKFYGEKHRSMFETTSLKIMKEWEQQKDELKKLKEQQREEREERKEYVKELERKSEEMEKRVEEVIGENRDMGAELKGLKTKVDKLTRQLKEQEERFDQEMKQVMIQLNNIDQPPPPPQPPPPAAVALSVAQPQIVKPSKALMQHTDTNRVWEFTVDNYTSRKADQEKWEGPIMTTPLGYNLQVDVWPNGQNNGKGSHVSVWMQYVKEVEEKKKKWPAKVTMTLELLNQYPGAEKWQNPIMDNFDILCDRYTRRYNYIGTFGNTLIAHETLGRNEQKKRQFLKDDSIQMRITLLDEQPIHKDEL